MASFESRDLTDIFENTTVINSLHEKMMKRRSYYQPNPEDFIGEPGYSELDIRNEIQKVKTLKKRWATETSPEMAKQKKISDIIEGIIVDQFSSSWLSEKVRGHYTAEADDILRGVDVVAELDREDGSHYLGFAIDVTMAKDPSVLDDKLARNWNDVTTSRFPEVKYFEDDNGKKRRLSPVRVLVAVNPTFARQLARLENRGDKEKLASHKFQSHLILQVKEQLESYYRYAQSVGNDALMDKLAESLRVFYEIIFKEKEQMLNDSLQEVESETDFLRIQDFCQSQLTDRRKIA